MESELSGIFRVKLVTKNIVRGSPGTQFMHMRVKLTESFIILINVIITITIIIWLYTYYFNTEFVFLRSSNNRFP